MDLERKLSELLYELPQKQDELEAARQRCEAERERSRAAAAAAAGLQAEAETATKELEWARKAMRRCEESLAAARDAAVRHKLALDAANKSADAMRDQACRLHFENTKLKTQIEELQKDIKSENFFRESCIAKKAKVESAIEALDQQRQKLEKDYKEIDRHAREAILVGNKMKLLLDQKDETIKELKEKCEELSSKSISVACEKSNSEEGMTGINFVEDGFYEKEIMQEWEASMNGMKARSASHEKELETLQKALQNAISAQMMFQNLEVAANEKIKDLELKLKVLEGKKKKIGMDISVQTETAISVDVACETHLEQSDASTQTEMIVLQPQGKEIEETTSKAQEGVGPQVETSDPQILADHNHSHFNIPGYSSILSNKNLMTTSSLGMLMSKLQQEREKDQGREIEVKEINNTKDISEMPTQFNPNIKNKNFENNEILQ